MLLADLKEDAKENSKDIPKIHLGKEIGYTMGIPSRIIQVILEKYKYLDNQGVITYYPVSRYDSYWTKPTPQVFSYNFFRDGLNVATYIPDMDMRGQYPLHHGVVFHEGRYWGIEKEGFFSMHEIT
jgi:hypothetical protein